MEETEKEKLQEQYRIFYMNYLISVLEGLRQKGKISEEIYINARNNAYKKYGVKK